MKRLDYNIGLMAVALISVALLQVSCLRDEIAIEGLDNGKIMFSIAGVESRSVKDSKATRDKSAVPVKDVSLEVEGQSLNLSIEVKDNNNRIFSEQNRLSRSQAFDETVKPVNKIFISSILNEGNGGTTYFKNDEVEITNSKGVTNRFWPNEQELSFFAYACTKDINMTGLSYSRAGGACSGTFKYTLPTPQANESPKDATNQADIIFAITPDCSMSGGTVDLEFHHALSAIVFKVGKMPEDVYLKSITIENVFSEGTCSMVAKDESDVEFTWSSLKNRKSYTETIGTEAVAGELMGSVESLFMMVPQTMDSNSKLTLNFSINGSDYTLSKSFKDFISSWEADKKYTITIGLPGDVDVEIADQVEGKVKHSVEIQNTGLSTGYIRAAIVGYWVNPDGIVGNALSATDGTFVWGDNWNTYWKKGSDGFYYHLLPVKHRDYTECPLFETFTLNDDSKTIHNNQVLELSLVVQIIPVEEKSLWSELN